ncbi:MAG: type VI secretion system needle protein Hcp [Tannerella sp.]|jgi:hypothetical protein|nr:type VI secretion system needle protein Hcp [Tannerella sp.]
MFGHRSFLMIGGGSPADIKSLINGGYEILDCRFSFEQGMDDTGKATTKVYGGITNITLSQLPPKEIIEWALDSRKYFDAAVIVLDANNIPLEKMIFKDASCINLKINYIQQGDSYATTEIVLHTKKLIVGNNVDFDNEWTF